MFKYKPSREPDLTVSVCDDIVAEFWWKERMQTFGRPSDWYCYCIRYVDDHFQWQDNYKRWRNHSNLSWFLINKDKIVESFAAFLIEEELSK